MAEAILSVCGGKEVPEGDPTIRDIYGWTVAMRLALHRKNIPTRWEHDPKL